MNVILVFFDTYLKNLNTSINALWLFGVWWTSRDPHGCIKTIYFLKSNIDNEGRFLYKIRRSGPWCVTWSVTLCFLFKKISTFKYISFDINHVRSTEEMYSCLNTRLMNLSPFKSHNLLNLSEQEVQLKVSKFKKQIFLFSFPPKNERNYFFDFCPSL